MRLTNERKVCAVVLTLALAALGVDRLFLDGGSPAAAAGAELLAPGAGNGDQADSPSKPEQVRASALIPVARQFARLESHADSTADGFSAPDQWRAAIELERARAEAAKPAQKAVATADASVAERWAKDKRLTSIFHTRTGDRTLALVNGKRLEIGMDLDGMVLVEIDEAAGSATFAEPSGDNQIEIVIPRPDAAKPSK